MTHNELHNLLLGLEAKVSTPSPRDFPEGGFVRKNLSPVQVFALHQQDAWSKRTKPSQLEGHESDTVVVAVGGNYTQAQESVPRDHKDNPPEVLDDFSCKQNFSNAFDQYSKDRERWVKLCSASSSEIALPAQFHFVMTNFCPWITTDSWQGMTPQVRAHLLVSNPAFGSVTHDPTKPWPHLDALAKALACKKVLWVAHGKDCEVFALFRLWNANNPDRDWLLLPNLSFPYRWDEGPFPEASK